MLGQITGSGAVSEEGAWGEIFSRGGESGKSGEGRKHSAAEQQGG